MNADDLIEHLNDLGFQRDDGHTWGYQLRCLNSPLYAAKFLIFTNSLPGSLHHHADKKDETFICLAGEVWVSSGEESKILVPGDVFHIPHFTHHRTVAVKFPAILLEVSTEDNDDWTYRD